jgi:hypothetical protein
MASVWLPADVPALVRLAVLMEQVFLGDVKKDLLNEIVKLEDRFGLSPKARRGLQWEIATGDAPAKTPAVKTERRLRAV